MESLKLNGEKLDEAINFLNENLSVKIFIIQKIKLISMFHDLLYSYNKESIFVSSLIDEIKIRVAGENKLAPVSTYVNQIITLYKGKIEITGSELVITIKTTIKEKTNF